MSASNDNKGVQFRGLDLTRPVTFVFEVQRPGFWAFVKSRSGQFTTLCSRDLNAAPPGSNMTPVPRRKQSHLQVVHSS